MYNELTTILIESNDEINEAINKAYKRLLRIYYKFKEQDEDPYIISELEKIIHLIEVSEDYNGALKLIWNLEIEINNHTCGGKYHKIKPHKTIVKYICYDDEAAQLRENIQADTGNYIIADVKKKIKGDGQTINLNYAVYDKANNILYLNGNFKLYYVVTEEIIKDLRNFLLYQEADFQAIGDDLILTVTDDYNII